MPLRSCPRNSAQSGVSATGAASTSARGIALRQRLLASRSAGSCKRPAAPRHTAVRCSWRTEAAVAPAWPVQASTGSPPSAIPGGCIHVWAVASAHDRFGRDDGFELATGSATSQSSRWDDAPVVARDCFPQERSSGLHTWRDRVRRQGSAAATPAALCLEQTDHALHSRRAVGGATVARDEA